MYLLLGSGWVGGWYTFFRPHSGTAVLSIYPSYAKRTLAPFGKIVMQFMSVIKGSMGVVRSKQFRDLDKREGLELEKKTFKVIIGFLGITVIGVSEVKKGPLGSKLAII